MFSQVTTAASSSSDGLTGGALFAVIAIVALVSLLHIVGMWKVLVKGGEPGAFSLLNLVACLLPFSYIPVMRMVGRPTWWVVLFYVPIVNLVILLLVSLGLSRSFGKGTGFGIGLWLLGPIFFIILGFGSSTYRGPVVPATARA
jgi:hypothetical protein